MFQEKYVTIYGGLGLSGCAGDFEGCEGRGGGALDYSVKSVWNQRLFRLMQSCCQAVFGREHGETLGLSVNFP